MDEFLDRRRSIVELYYKELSGSPQLRIVLPKNRENSSFWKLPILLSEEIDRKKLMKYLKENGVFADTAYNPPLHLQPVFKEIFKFKEGMLPITENILKRHICLPCHPRLTDSDVDHVSKTLLEAIKIN